MLTCQNLPELSAQRSKQRLEVANRALGSALVRRLLAFALYLLGASRRSLSELLGLPADTVKSLTQRVISEGLPALEDRRRRHSTFLPAESPPALQVALEVGSESLVVVLDEERRVVIPRANKVQSRTVLLTFLQARLLSTEAVAEGLGLSTDRVRTLSRELEESDAAALIDQRKGQQREYRVTPEVKAELIQQFLLNVVTSSGTSSSRLKADLEKRCQITLEDRTIRHHIARLGLRDIGRSLRQLLGEVKKT
jgi:transposase